MKPQLHKSGLELLWKCGEAYYQKYVLGNRKPKSAALVLGLGTHQSIAENLTAKVQTGEPLPEDQVVTIARDHVAHDLEEEVIFNGEWSDLTTSEASGQMIDAAVNLSRLHYREAAPRMRPLHVERPFTLDIAGISHQVCGSMDVDEGTVIADTKTSRKSPSKDAAHVSLQGTMYALAKRTIDGVTADFRLDYLVRLKRESKLVQIQAPRSDEDFTHLLERIARADAQIQAGLFQPAPLDAWWCSAEWCEYHSTCRFARRPMTVVL